MGTRQQFTRSKNHEKVYDSKTRALHIVSHNDNILNQLINLLLECRYNKLSREVRTLSEKIKALDPKDPFRNERGAQLLEKL